LTSAASTARQCIVDKCLSLKNATVFIHDALDPAVKRCDGSEPTSCEVRE
jgi:hypothetical protein